MRKAERSLKRLADFVVTQPGALIGNPDEGGVDIAIRLIRTLTIERDAALSRLAGDPPAKRALP